MIHQQTPSKRINAYILLVFFKSDSTYEIENIEELEYFLSLFSISMKSFSLKSAGGTLNKSKNEVYRLEGVFESEDDRVSVSKRRYVSSPRRIKNSISFVCNIKGVKYPLSNYRTDPFRKTGIAQEEILDPLSLLSSEGILRKPVEYSGDTIYLYNDQDLYDLFFDLSAFSYGWVKSILCQIWNLRRPEPEEKHWLQKIEGELAVTKAIDKARENRRRSGLSHHRKIELMRNILKETSTYIKEIEVQLKKDYQDTLSDPRYEFIIQEVMKFVFPNWVRKIRTYKSSSKPKNHLKSKWAFTRQDLWLDI